ncbi:unnamed protein product [Orchesella dallaii]|uniref:Uncharacterized protein n=1 Tax=Orchesella dallaii TaxID=48710 RepID=A0ABP1S809_9HEXA
MEEIQVMQETNEKLLEYSIKLPKMEMDKLFRSPKTCPMLLPENWEFILTILPPPDFLSAINSCVEWNVIMHTKKTAILLPLVIPHVIKYLPINTLLNCRLKNKSGFKKAMDTFLQQYFVDIIFTNTLKWTSFGRLIISNIVN